MKSWNGRRYIREALAAAFAQTYRPLEIVVVDDASDDGSWEEIESFCAEQPPDPEIRVVIRRNHTNLGSLGNWEETCSLAYGELLVKADGDDVSSPDRVARIAAAWMADGRRAMAVCHSGWQIGRLGEGRGFFVRSRQNGHSARRWPSRPAFSKCSDARQTVRLWMTRYGRGGR